MSQAVLKKKALLFLKFVAMLNGCSFLYNAFVSDLTKSQKKVKHTFNSFVHKDKNI